MPFIAAAVMRLKMLFARRAAAARLDEELHFHLEQAIAENLRAGMTPSEARCAALRAFGNPALVRDQARTAWSWSGLEQFLPDLHYGIRTLRRTPGFTLIAILVMALGIGANVALFTVVHSVLLKPLPYPHPEQLFAIFENSGDRHPQINPYLPVAPGSFWEWQRAAAGTAEMAALSPWQDYNVSAENGRLPEHVRGGWCTWNLLPMLGVQPALGRGFTVSDDRPGAPATVLLAHALWQRRYASDPRVVGSTLWLDAKPYTVIGVLPAWFVYSSSYGGSNIQLWAPVRHEAPASMLNTFQDHEFLAYARLAPGVTGAALVQRLSAVQRQVAKDHPNPDVFESVIGRSMLDDAVADYKTTLWALLGATGCLLLIACMNVAGLAVARTASRAREHAIRTALGSGRLRLIRERLLESLLFSLAGGALGLALAWVALRWLVHVRQDMNRIETIHIDAVVLAFAAAAILLCALFSGSVAAAGAGGANLLAGLHDSPRGHRGSRARTGLRKTLIVLQVSLTVVLLVGAGLLLKSFDRLRNTDLGVPVDNVLTMHISLPAERYKQPQQRVAFFENLIARIRALPGVQSAGLVSSAPGEGWNGDHVAGVVEHPGVPRAQDPDLMVRGADPGYFAAIGIPLLEGRVFTASERLERSHVVLISRKTAETLFPHEDPLGRHLRLDDDPDGPTYRILGVVGDTRWTASLPALPTVYWPIYGNDYSEATVVLRAPRNVEDLSLPVQKTIAQMDSDLPVSDVETLRQAIGKTAFSSQFDAILVLGFALIALILAAAGLFGVLSYMAAQRRGEIGIRLALGAPREQVLGKMLSDGLRPALIGLLFGLAASVEAARLLRSMLYATQPLDPVVFAVVAATLLAVAALACAVPAWRASRVEPMQALRTE